MATKLPKAPTMRQRKAMGLFLKYMEQFNKGEIKNPPTMKEILAESGYGKSAQDKPQVITHSQTWQDFMSSIDDTPIVQKLHQWAKDDDPAVRGHSIRAAQEVLKLKDRYPATKSKHSHLHAELKDLYQ